MNKKFWNLRCGALSTLAIVMAILLVSSPALGEDDGQMQKHQMGMQMKKGGMMIGGYRRVRRWKEIGSEKASRAKQ